MINDAHLLIPLIAVIELYVVEQCHETIGSQAETVAFQSGNQRSEDVSPTDSRISVKQ